MADGNPSGRHPAPASRLLPRRIHLPLQPPALPGPRTALPSPRPAGRRQRAGTVPSDHCRQRSSPALEATCVKGILICGPAASAGFEVDVLLVVGRQRGARRLPLLVARVTRTEGIVSS